MRPCPDDAFEWIRNGQEKGLSRKTPDWKGNCVSHLIPKSFVAYAKILHRIEPNYSYIDNPLTERENVILKIPPCNKLRSFVESLRKERQDQRIRWTTLAQLLNVPFAPEVCHEWFRTNLEDTACGPRFLCGPDDGNLCPDELAEVLSVLIRFTGRQDCYFRFFQYSNLALNDEPFLFCGVLEELGTFLTEGKHQFTPEYWWPADHSWCLCSEYDLTFTLVGGSREMISAVLNNTVLEALEVTPQTRIDSYAPIPK